LLNQSADGIFAARADVAQLVEQRFRKPQVTGSNPVVGSIHKMSASAPSVSIIVPTLNEEENISPLISQIIGSAVPFREILFVDDNSTDATADRIRALATRHPIRLIEQNGAHLGLTGAIVAGARSAQGEILLVMDADLSHPPERIKDLLAPLFAGEADMVVGSRYVEGGSTPGWPMWRRIVSRGGAALAYPLTGVHDSMGGFFAIARSRLLELAPKTSGFKIVFDEIVRGGGTLRVREIPIAFRERLHGISKMSFGIALRFFLRWLDVMFRHLIRRSDRPAETARAFAVSGVQINPEASELSN
jgi:dolichol-phosphate mannosyltransferase